MGARRPLSRQGKHPSLGRAGAHGGLCGHAWHTRIRTNAFLGSPGGHEGFKRLLGCPCSPLTIASHFGIFQSSFASVLHQLGNRKT